MTARTPPVATGHGGAPGAAPGDVPSLGSLPGSPVRTSPKTPNRRRTSVNSQGSSQFEEEYPTPAEQRNSARRKQFAWQGPRSDAAHVANPFRDRVSYDIHGTPPKYHGAVHDPQSASKEDGELDPVHFYGQAPRVLVQRDNWPERVPSIESVQQIVPAATARDPGGDDSPGSSDSSSDEEDTSTGGSSRGDPEDSDVSVTPIPQDSVSIGHSSHLRRFRDLLEMEDQLQPDDFEEAMEALWRRPSAPAHAEKSAGV